MYCRIDLSKTNYIIKTNYEFFDDPPADKLIKIYEQYCTYKKFESFWPLFPEQFAHQHHDVIGYYDDDNLVAFSLVYRFNDKNAECFQFAWDYQNPKLRLGFESLKTECAVYKAMGFDYYYLGEYDQYKEQFDGFEILGPLQQG